MLSAMSFSLFLSLAHVHEAWVRSLFAVVEKSIDPESGNVLASTETARNHSVAG